MCYVGLDAGTTGIKALAFDDAGTVLASAYQEYPLIIPQNGWSELDPEDIWKAVKAVLHSVAVTSPEEIQVIAVASCAQAVVPVDEDGKTLYRFISTIDTRTTSEDRWWRDNKDESVLFQRTGLPFSAIYTANKLLWLKKNEPELFKKARHFFLVQDFLTWKLSGECLIDYSLASRGMMFNIHTCEWDEEVLGIVGITSDMLSQPVPAATIAGRVKRDVCIEVGLPFTTMAAVGSHDQICGTIGCGCVGVGMTTDAAGTIEALLSISGDIPSMDGLIRTHFPCIPHAIQGRYTIMSINQNSGVLLRWYRNLLTMQGQAPIPYSDLIDESIDHVADVFVLPHLNGTETPIMDPVSAAAFVRIRLHHTRADLTRAVLDAIAYDMRQQLEAFETMGIYISNICAIGGGSKSDKLLQMKADCVRREIRTCKISEAAALGAAILGAVSVGAFSSITEAVHMMVKTKRIFYPREDESIAYDRGYELFKRLQGTLKEINHLKL